MKKSLMSASAAVVISVTACNEATEVLRDFDEGVGLLKEAIATTDDLQQVIGDTNRNGSDSKGGGQDNGTQGDDAETSVVAERDDAEDILGMLDALTYAYSDSGVSTEMVNIQGTVSPEVRMVAATMSDGKHAFGEAYAVRQGDMRIQGNGYATEIGGNAYQSYTIDPDGKIYFGGTYMPTAIDYHEYGRRLSKITKYANNASHKGQAAPYISLQRMESAYTWVPGQVTALDMNYADSCWYTGGYRIDAAHYGVRMLKEDDVHTMRLSIPGQPKSFGDNGKPMQILRRNVQGGRAIQIQQSDPYPGQDGMAIAEIEQFAAPVPQFAVVKVQAGVPGKKQMGRLLFLLPDGSIMGDEAVRDAVGAGRYGDIDVGMLCGPERMVVVGESGRAVIDYDGTVTPCADATLGENSDDVWEYDKSDNDHSDRIAQYWKMINREYYVPNGYYARIDAAHPYKWYIGILHTDGNAECVEVEPTNEEYRWELISRHLGGSGGYPVLPGKRVLACAQRVFRDGGRSYSRREPASLVVIKDGIISKVTDLGISKGSEVQGVPGTNLVDDQFRVYEYGLNNVLLAARMKVNEYTSDKELDNLASAYYILDSGQAKPLISPAMNITIDGVDSYIATIDSCTIEATGRYALAVVTLATDPTGTKYLLRMSLPEGFEN